MRCVGRFVDCEFGLPGCVAEGARGGGGDGGVGEGEGEPEGAGEVGVAGCEEVSEESGGVQGEEVADGVGYEVEVEEVGGEEVVEDLEEEFGREGEEGCGIVRNVGI